MSRKKHFLITPIFSVIGRVGGMIIPFLIAAVYEVGPATDGFFLAYGLMISLSGLFFPLFESLLVPYLAEWKEDNKQLSRFVNSVALINFPIIVGIALLVGLGLRPFLVNTSGLSAVAIDWTTKLYMQMIPMLLAGALVAAANGVFYVKKIFWYPAFSPFIRSLGTILFILFLHGPWKIEAISYGFVWGEVFRWVVTMILIYQLADWRLTFAWKEHFEKIRSFLGQSVWHLLALLALNLIPLTDQWFSSFLGEGQLSLISYSDRLFQIPFQLMMTGFLQIFLSYWSDQYYQGSPLEFWDKAKVDIRKVLLLTVGFTVLLFFGRQLLVRFVFGFGKMTGEEARVIGDLFGCLMIGFPAAILNLLYVRVLFVLKKSSVFLTQSCVRLVLNILFNAIMMRFWGLYGLALSTSAVFIGTTWWLHSYLTKWERKEQAKA